MTSITLNEINELNELYKLYISRTSDKISFIRSKILSNFSNQRQNEIVFEGVYRDSKTQSKICEYTPNNILPGVPIETNYIFIVKEFDKPKIEIMNKQQSAIRGKIWTDEERSILFSGTELEVATVLGRSRSAVACEKSKIRINNPELYEKLSGKKPERKYPLVHQTQRKNFDEQEDKIIIIYENDPQEAAKIIGVPVEKVYNRKLNIKKNPDYYNKLRIFCKNLRSINDLKKELENRAKEKEEENKRISESTNNIIEVKETQKSLLQSSETIEITPVIVVEDNKQVEFVYNGLKLSFKPKGIRFEKNQVIIEIH